MPKLSDEDLKKRFNVDDINMSTAKRSLRTAYYDLACKLVFELPEGRALSVALTELETSMLWSLNAVED